MQLDIDRFRKVVRGETTQTELADKLGIAQSEVSRLVRRGGKMKVDQFLAICAAIGYEPSAFFQEAVDPTLLINNPEVLR